MAHTSHLIIGNRRRTSNKKGHLGWTIGHPNVRRGALDRVATSTSTSTRERERERDHWKRGGEGIRVIRWH